MSGFDLAYSVGVLHHTGDALAGFKQLCRVVKPGGIVIVSLYNTWTRGQIGIRQRIVGLLAGEDADKRARLGQRLFPFTMRRMSKRYHNANVEELAYDTFGILHETYHTAPEVLDWFDENGISYLGAFAPLRVPDYPVAFSMPEYHQFKSTFDGFPLVRWTGDLMNKLGSRASRQAGEAITFKRPSRASMWLCQFIWALLGVRFHMFTIAGRKQ